MLVLKALSWGPMHGFGISQWLESRTDGRLGLDDSSMYQVLHRLEERGFVNAKWQLTDNNRRARFYRLTTAGRNRLRDHTETWNRTVSAMTAALNAKAGEI